VCVCVCGGLGRCVGDFEGFFFFDSFRVARSAPECVAVCGVVLQCGAVWCSVVQCVAVSCSVLQCVAVCCSVLQCVAVFIHMCDMSHSYMQHDSFIHVT